MKTSFRSQTARDTLEISVAPVIFSHSSAQALCNSARNVPDQLLKLTVAFSTYVSVSTFGVSGGQEGPGDDQLLLLLHNLFKRFIYNRCDRWANKRSIDGDWICLSTYQPREGGGWHRLRRHRGQLRRHQCVSQARSLLLVSFLSDRVPEGLEDVSKYANLFSSLYGSGNWTLLDLKKLAGLNFLRVWKDVEQVKENFWNCV